MNITLVSANKKSLAAVKPMMILGDSREVIHLMIESSEAIRERKPDAALADFDFAPCDTLYLDPGGMCMAAQNQVLLDIDGVAIEFKPELLPGIIPLVESGLERVPNYVRFPSWNANIFVPVGFHPILLKALREAETSPEVANAWISMEEKLDKAARSGYFVRKLPAGQK